MSKCLNELKKGQAGTLLKFASGLDAKLKRRLLELGFFCGTKVTVCQISFLKEVLLLQLNGYLVSLRSDIAKYVLVEVKGE